MDLHRQAIEIVSKLSLEEKCKLCVGKSFWELYGVDSLDIPSIRLSDGPHGLRKEEKIKENVFSGKGEKSVCFPTASGIASTFDKDLIFKMGKSLGEECREKNIAVLLGPGTNEKRIPICGRNFEYFSEDPYLTGKIASAYIKGVQSQGVGTSIKHFIGNNQEKYRMVVNSIIDERAMREIYLKGMEIAIKEANPWTVMMAYNRVNGNYCSENSVLITEILRNEWGYNNLIISDWGGVNNFIDSRVSGLDLEMPGYDDNYYKIIQEYVENGELDENIISESATRIIELILKYKCREEIPYTYDVYEQINLSQKIAEESAVLLKNEDDILPGNTKQSIAVIGQFAKKPRYEGLGSSQVNPIILDNAYDAFVENGCNITYSKGYPLTSDENEEELLTEAINISKGKDIVYLFVGTPSYFECEGIDRKDMKLLNSHENLIKEVGKVNKNLVVILQSGSAVEIDWSDYCKGILLTHLGGSRGGHATVNLLLGYKNPCGKLSETYPIHLKDCPAMKYYPGQIINEEYRESIFVGYRYYDTAKIKVKYPFGYGLSYSNFEYSNLMIKYKENNNISVEITITNTGKREGKEIVQLYISCLNPDIFRAKKELKAFEKIQLEVGESKIVKFYLNKESFEYYNVLTHNYEVESGYYKIQIASSCEDIRLTKLVYMNGNKVDIPNYRDLTPSYYLLEDNKFDVSQEEFMQLYGGKLPLIEDKIRPFTTNSTIRDIKNLVGGKLLVSIINKKAEKIIGDDELMSLISEESMDEIPFRLFVMITRGNISREDVNIFVDFFNKRFIKGTKKIIKRSKI